MSSKMILKLLLSTCCALPASVAYAEARDVVLTSTAVAGHSFPKVCYAGDPKKCAMRLAVGEAAPFPGVLQTFRQAAELAAKAEMIEARIAVEVEAHVRLVEIDLKAERDRALVDLDAERQANAVLREAMTKAEPPFYERPAFVIPITVVLTLGMAALAIEGAKGL